MERKTVGCDHVGPLDIFRMAEDYLREKGVPMTGWEGARFGFGENVTGQRHSSVYTEIERRGSDWIVTAIERRPDPIAPGEEGLAVRHLPA